MYTLFTLFNQMKSEYEEVIHLRKFVPFADKCSTHARVRQSHYDKASGTVEVFQMKNIYGMLMLLAMGLFGSVSAFIAGRFL